MAFEAYPGIYREEAIMLLRDFYMQENHNGILFTAENSEVWWVAPAPKLKASRKKKLDFDEFEWAKYISEEALLKSVPTVYGCDPRDKDKYRKLLGALNGYQGDGESVSEEETDTWI